MLINYMTMIAELKVLNGTNDFGEPNYIAKNINCRIVEKFKEVTDEKGNKVVSSGIIQCTEPIKVGYLVNDKRIIAVNSMTMLDGVVGYRGYLL